MSENHRLKKALICIPYAGGSAVFFKELIEVLQEQVDCFALEYAGHGKRRKEPFYQDWKTLLDDLAGQINEIAADYETYALFGYSIGSAVVYELIAQELLIKQPAHVFLSSHSASDVEWKSKQYHLLSDEEFVETLKEKGGFDKINGDILNNDRFRRIFFEPIRNDYRLIHLYQMSRHIVFPMPVSVFYSEPDMTEEAIHTWDSFLNGNSRYHRFDGNHFFIKEHIEEVADIIQNVFQE